MRFLTNHIIAGLVMTASLLKTGSPTEVDVMTFNMRTSAARDPCPCGCWEERGSRATQYIMDHLADFVSTQECSKEQKSVLDQGLKTQYFSVGEATSDTPNMASNTWGTNHFRNVVFGRFRRTGSDITVCIFNTHYAVPSEITAQSKSSELVIDNMRTVCQDSDSLITLTGDLNADPQAVAIKYLVGEGILPNSYPLTSSVAGGTWCGSFTSAYCSTTQYDYIFYRANPSARLEVHKSTQILRETIDACYLSDHAIVRTKFCLNSCEVLVPPSRENNTDSATEYEEDDVITVDNEKDAVRVPDSIRSNDNDATESADNQVKHTRGSAGPFIVFGIAALIIATILVATIAYRYQLHAEEKQHNLKLSELQNNPPSPMDFSAHRFGSSSHTPYIENELTSEEVDNILLSSAQNLAIL